MVRVADALRWQLVRHLDVHADWLSGACRLVAMRSFPFAGFEYPRPAWMRERDHAR